MTKSIITVLALSTVVLFSGCESVAAPRYITEQDGSKTLVAEDLECQSNPLYQGSGCGDGGSDYFDWAPVDLYNDDFKNTSMRFNNFAGAVVVNTEFVNVDLTGSDFSGAKLTNVEFINCNLTDVKINKNEIKLK